MAPRTLRAIGAGLLVEPAAPFALESLGWLNAAAELDPHHRYAPEDLPEDHQLFAVWASAVGLVGTVEPVTQAGELVAGSHWLDGRPLEAARLRPDVPHLYQLQLEGERRITGWILTHGRLPEEALVADASDPTQGAIASVPPASTPASASPPASTSTPASPPTQGAAR